ncbi:MAG: hypothetical protein AAGA80_05905 [Cyanobacteria bacterium P01_F01_bin.143]
MVDFGAVQDSFAPEGTTFTVVGTYGYAPLEQFGGKTVPASDLYALGITLIHLLTRTAPNNLPNKDLKIQFRDRVTVSSQLANWLDKMIAPAVEKRYKTAISALKHLPDMAQELTSIEQAQTNSKLDQTEKLNSTNTPVGSNIKIKKNSDFLEIIIPGQVFIKLRNFFETLFGKSPGFPSLLVVGSIIFFLRIMFSPMIMFALIILWLIYPDFRDLFITTKIRCDRTQFSIINSFCGFSKIRRGITSAINGISLQYTSPNKKQANSKIESLIINTESTSKLHANDTYILGQNISEDELLWLVKELRNWLNNHEKQEQISDKVNNSIEKTDFTEPKR